MLAVRTVTAAALIAGFIAALFLLERSLFALLIGAVLASAAWEWAVLSGLRGAPAAGYAGACALAYALLAWASWPPGMRAGPIFGAVAVAAAFWAVAAPLLLRQESFPRSGLALPGFMVLVPAGLCAIGFPRASLLALLGLVWVCDTFAYLVGRTLGRHRLAPAVSPGKTVEGAAGAVAASVAYAVILALFMPDLLRPPHGIEWVGYLAAAVLLCFAGMVGDLFESWAKRRAGIKDSGRLLPGHGGILDRIDSACAVLPIGALLISWWERG